ncbi:PQQ-dependent sugar dehydrogenase [Halomonas denitrificans]|uniref:PQQ-dependent sugar dehydrogenase n=1 Tax=Halomonas denitrificans TaxID=370769 RepID=UPI001C991E47|nr:PQQ-dependent sugar dehydrogenase [Halomonas denitrificans]MBY5967316.1 PQQ-dependent sugar dehydrogenase [Halomonas denitrificans]
MIRRLILTLSLTATAPSAWAEPPPTEVPGLYHPVALEVITDALDTPWSLTFLPDGRLLVGEQHGSLALIDDGQVDTLTGLPEVSTQGQGGLFDLALHPDYGDGVHDWLYFAWARPALSGDSQDQDAEGDATAVSRVWWDGERLGRVEPVFVQNRFSRPGRHYGGRLLFDHQGLLWLSIGDRGDGERAQDARDHAGSLLRMTAEGAPATDNPAIEGAAAELYSLGHRNPQGLALAADGRLWATEHGPRGGDELNLIQPGENYGWPDVTRGRDYATNLPLGVDSAPGKRDPLHVFEGRFAPSGLAVVSGNEFADWQGDLLAGGLRSERLVRLRFDADQLIEREVILDGEVGRIRDVRVGPEGAVYLLTDANPGRLIRLSRAR